MSPRYGVGSSEVKSVPTAWLVCALVASIALAVSNDFHAPASASVATALMQPTPGNGEMPLTARK